MLTSRLFASTSFRLSAIYAALLVFSFVFAASGAWLATRTAAMDEAAGRLEDAYQSFAGTLEGRGVEGAMSGMERRSHHNGVLWRIEDRDGAHLGGDPTLPSAALGLRMIDLPDEGEVDFPDTADEPRGDHAVLTRALPDGGTLTLAVDIEASEISRDAVLNALLGAGAISVLLALALGVWATRSAFARMDALAGAARAFGAGDLTARAPHKPRTARDDVDQLAAHFNDMFEQVDRLVTNVKRVSADVAHELRTPLTHVRQRLDEAATATTSEARANAIEAAQKDVEELQRTFEAMLSLSEIEAGGMRRRFESADIAAIVETVCDAYRPDIEASGRSLTVRLSTNAGLQGESRLLAQAAANLLENALRHTPMTAHVVVDVARVGDDVVLAVSDDGPGVPANERERVVEPFQRLDASRTTRGSGLGLSIVSAIARLHDAVLRLEDAGPGLRAVIVFPGAARRP